MLSISSYEGLKGLSFGASESEVVEFLGEPEVRRAHGSGEQDLCYEDHTAILDKEARRFSELTLYPGARASINGRIVDWTSDLRWLADQDSGLWFLGGVVVSFAVGVSVMGFGIQEGDEYDSSITCFRRGAWDDQRAGMPPYSLE